MGVSEADDGLIKRTVELLKDVNFQNQMRNNARKLLEEHCNPKSTVDSIERLYTKIINANDMSS